MNRAQRRKAKKRDKAFNELRMENRQDANRVINKFATRWKECKTPEEQEALVNSLSDEELRDVKNAYEYMKVQAFFAYTQLPAEAREELQKGNLDVIPQRMGVN